MHMGNWLFIYKVDYERIVPLALMQWQFQP